MNGELGGKIRDCRERSTTARGKLRTTEGKLGTVENVVQQLDENLGQQREN